MMCSSLRKPVALLLVVVCVVAVTTIAAAAEAGISAGVTTAGNLAEQHRVYRPQGSRRRLTQEDRDRGRKWILLFKRDQTDAKQAINKLISHIREFREDLFGGGGGGDGGGGGNTTAGNNSTWVGSPPPPPGGDPGSPNTADNSTSNSTDNSTGNSTDNSTGNSTDGDWEPPPLAVEPIGQDMSADIDGGSASEGAGPGVKGLVLGPDAVDDTLLEAVAASDDMVMIPDYELKLEGRPMEDDGADDGTASAAAATRQVCPLPAQLSSGIPGSLPVTVWSLSCVNPMTRLLFLAETCGASANQILYRAVMAVDSRNRIVKDMAGRPCLLKRDDLRQTARWNLMRFGGCGSAPTASAASRAMPTTICANSPAIQCLKTIGGAPIVANMLVKTSMTPRTPVVCNKKPKSQFNMEGVSCGPNNKFIRWTKATAADDGCVLLPNQDDPKFTADLFGLGCGTPPALAVQPLQTQQCVGERNLTLIKDTIRMPRMRLAPGVSVPAGVARIEAYHPDSGLVDMASFRMLDRDSREVQVAVIDSGIDASHPDLSVSQNGAVFGIASACDGDDRPDVDCNGHGTQVAGVVGATSTATRRGLIGVVPGVTLVPLKVVNGQGKGALSNLLQAMDYAHRTLMDWGVKVVVISLSFETDPDTFGYEAIKKTICQVFEEASASGMVIVAAAGNYAKNIEGLFPACCPSVLAVTAINVVNNMPAPFSNFLPDDAQDLEKSMLFAAPGTGINTTTPKSIDPTGYSIIQGTSVAAPHVAGVAASCMMTGACNSGMSGTEKAAVLQAAAVQRTQFDPFDFYDYTYIGGPGSTKDGKFFGNLVWDMF